jgi:dipeptidyl aminopeptidase/acylaminoacyl peptidase
MRHTRRSPSVPPSSRSWPRFHADKIKRPLIVLQGANDPRVIKPESDDIVAAVKKNGVPGAATGAP